jgi:flagellin
MISLQTNVDSLLAQDNLNINNEFQSKTIQQLTSGYRINNAGDDAAGLAVANEYQSSIVELTQGVNNANDGVSQLQIVDGGLSNIETILNRMKTLASESASGTFTGDRNTLNQEYQQLVSEITRQASNINLNAGGSFNTNLSVFIGGGNNMANNSVQINLSGAANAVDATSLGLTGTSVVGGSGGLSGNVLNLTTPGATFVTGGSNQSFSFNYINSSGAATTATATLTASSTGYTLNQALASLNQQLQGTGITASTDSNGQLQFSSSGAFTVADSNTSGGTTNGLTSYGVTPPTGAGYGSNSANYGVSTSANPAVSAGTDTLVFTTSAGAQVSVGLTSATGDTAAHAIAALNTALSSYGIHAVANASGNGISFQSANSFSVTEATDSSFAGTGVFGATTASQAATSQTVSGPSSAGAGTTAITSIDNAIKQLGLVQGVIGAGENTLNYAINLANSQISSLSTAESDIKDANVAADAANLTKAQVLVQTSIAALAQANAEPQAVLKLLQG